MASYPDSTKQELVKGLLKDIFKADVQDRTVNCCYEYSVKDQDVKLIRFSEEFFEDREAEELLLAIIKLDLVSVMAFEKRPITVTTSNQIILG